MGAEITVRLFYPLRELIGARTICLTPERTTLLGLLEHFLAVHPEVSDEVLEEGREVSYRYLVVVNDQVVPRSLWDETELSEDDRVAFLPLVAGG